MHCVSSKYPLCFYLFFRSDIIVVRKDRVARGLHGNDCELHCIYCHVKGNAQLSLLIVGENEMLNTPSDSYYLTLI
jgi:hypothetical protein